jgi:CRISPR-associated endonuclease Csn1
MKKILGLDLGTNSIGWALIGENEEKKEILGMGSRIIPMGTDKQDYERGVGVTKNAIRREKRSARKMNKRYKLRRNKLLYILYELGILPEQFQFKNGIPEANKIQDLELLPIKKGTIQLDSLAHYELRFDAIKNPVGLNDFGKILYRFNQLRGYAGGNNDEDTKRKNDENEEDNEKKTYEVITQKVEIISVEKSDKTFKVKGGKNKGEEQSYYDVTISLNDEELQGSTMLQNLKEKEGKEEELEIRIKRTKKGENIIFALPQKTNWRKQMEATEELLKNERLFISELLLRDLKQNKWAKIRNRVVLRHRYEDEFDAIWEIQARHYPFLNSCPKETLNKIAWYLFPGESKTQEQFRKDAIEGGLKYIIKNQIIYYQRPLKPQKELISKCQFEKEEQVIANSHPLFQEFRCWDQINRMFITSKSEVYNEKRGKHIFQYTDRFFNQEEKQEIYLKLQNQKQISFGEIAKIVKLKNDKTEYLNGLNVKAKLKGCNTAISIKKALGEHYDTLIKKDVDIVENIWKAVFDNSNYGSEYDPNSKRVSSITNVLQGFMNVETAVQIALNIAKNIKFPRKYASLSKKAICNILPLMQLNPNYIPEKVKDNFSNIQHLIETGEILNENRLEDYVISFVKNNPDSLEKGGIMYAFASSLVYGKHTKETVKAQIFNYHEIQYTERNLRNPIVEQIVNETMQVVKAIWKEYKFDPKDLEIRVELARDLKNSASEREKIYKGQLNNQKINESIRQRLIELKQEPTQGNIDLYKLWSKQNIEDHPKQSNEPTQEEILKLRIWEEQKCISPYTHKPIPLSKLFSSERLYDIDHIIPKSRYFDDSISNKVVCETDINEEKSNRTAWEYISQQDSKFAISSVECYIKFVNDNFYGKKKKNLLLEKIPSNLVERQIKHTQYISLAIKDELAKIVGSKNVKTSTGEVTSFLRSRWGLKKLFMELTESRFKQMELWDWNKEINQPNREWVKKYYDKDKQKHIYEIKNWSKRYDHRHHSIDALIVALTEQSHVQRLNNLNKYFQDELAKRKDEFKIDVKEDETILEVFFNLEEKRREEIQRKIESSRYFDIPIPDLVKQAREHLETMVISHKPKDKLGIKEDDKTGKKQLKIRAALHQETYYGKLNGQDTKTIEISKLSAKDISKVIDEVLRKEIDSHKRKYASMKEAFTGEGLKTFNESRFQRKKPTALKPPVLKVKVRYNYREEAKSNLQRLYAHNDKLSVITGDNYLFIVMEKEGKKGNERIFDIASLYDSVDIATAAIKNNDFNFKQKIAEDFRVIHKEKPDKVLFTLQQNELVYLPLNIDDPVLNFTKEEFKKWIDIKENKIAFNKRIYKVVKFTGKDCFFIPHNYSNSISIPKDFTENEKVKLRKIYDDKKIPKHELNFEEFGSFGTATKTEVDENFVKELVLKKDFNGKKPLKIQDTCIKINIDWLGNISL